MRPRVLVPFTRLHPATVAALEGDQVDATFADTSGPDAYWRVLADWWARRESFIVLEHDKVPEPGLLQELWDCREPWCSVPVVMQGTDRPAPYASLSCTKFDERLMRWKPSLLEDVGELDLGFGEREWSRLDLGIAGLLSSVAPEPHWHSGVVEHLHEVAA